MVETINTAEQNIINTFKDKRILVLENDYSLPDDVVAFMSILNGWIKEERTIFSVGEIPFEYLTKAIDEFDVIVFQTTWIRKVSTELQKYVMSLDQKKEVVEVYIMKPTWVYKPNTKADHDVYIFRNSMGIPDQEHHFYKLSEEPFWDYKNKFDK